MIAEITNYLRSRAHTCILLARACPDMPTSRGLEELAIDLMAKAKEIEELYSQGVFRRPDHCQDRPRYSP